MGNPSGRDSDAMSLDKSSSNEEGDNNLCPYCNGIGIFIGHCPDLPEYHGNLFFCNCEAGQRQRQDYIERQIALSNVPKRWRSFSFESYLALPLSASQRAALEICQRYATDWQVTLSTGQTRSGLYLFGPVGVGKTGLMAAIVRKACEAGIPALYEPMPDLLDDLRSSYNTLREIGVEIHVEFNRAKSYAMLALDDLGAERVTEWMLEKLYQLVDYRYRNDECKTLITSNYSPEQLLARLDRGDGMAERIIDRILEMCAPVEITGNNLRK